MVKIENDGLDCVIRWAGDDHTFLRIRKNRKGQHRWAVDGEIVDLVRVLARQMPDKAIAAILNRAGKFTGKGNAWTRSRVSSLRNNNAIEVYREGERIERGEATLDDAAEALNVSTATVRRLIASGVLPAAQHCKGSPYVIKSADLDRPDVRAAADGRRKRLAKPPPSENQTELPL